MGSVPAERIVPDARQYILEAIDAEATYDPEIWDTPGFALVFLADAKMAARMPQARASPQQP
jgi:hypothetical protein